MMIKLEGANRMQRSMIWNHGTTFLIHISITVVRCLGKDGTEFMFIIPMQIILSIFYTLLQKS